MRVSVVPLLCAILMVGLSSLRAQQPQEAAPPPAPPQQAPASGASIVRDVNLVDVLFTVSNRQNKNVVDMDQQDFKVRDDNTAQEIRFFSRQTDLPLRVG